MTKASEEQVRTLIADLKNHGYVVGLRDISFAILCRFFEDPSIAYHASYGVPDKKGAKELDESSKMEDLREYLEEHFFEEEDSTTATDIQDKEDELSFNELKRGLVEDMNALIELRDSVVRDEEGNEGPALDPKEMATVVARIADIRVKLTDKFGTTQDNQEQKVVVMQKYNDVCPYCGHEVAAKIVEKSK